MLIAGTSNRSVISKRYLLCHRFLKDCPNASIQVQSDFMDRSGLFLCKSSVTFQSAAATIPHMLIESKNGDVTMLATNKQALQKASP